VLPHHSTPSLPCSTRTFRDTRSFSPSYWCPRIFITSSALYLRRLGFSFSGYRTASHNTLGTRRLKLLYNHLHISRQHLLQSTAGVVRWCARHTSPYDCIFGGNDFALLGRSLAICHSHTFILIFHTLTDFSSYSSNHLWRSLKA
jgi:hypothetical protein